jgi:predicted membrane channel-forming protein YqfA (hemolysin III family)
MQSERRRDTMFVQGVMMTHVALGVIGIMFAVALFVDVLNVNEGNIERIKKLSLAVAVLIVLAYIIGGYWYVVYYGHDRDIIKAGQWPWAHNYFMEVKEHLFFVMLLLGIYLPIAVYRNAPLMEKEKRCLVLGICALIVVLGFFMEGAGGIIGKGVTMGLMGR